MCTRSYGDVYNHVDCCLLELETVGYADNRTN